ncbi:hypothetical protein J6590_002654 [Homalodisca vitripennis]|nr:hypothetical protein J6590_002654 [Homalodisca vitripennis]
MCLSNVKQTLELTIHRTDRITLRTPSAHPPSKLRWNKLIRSCYGIRQHINIHIKEGSYKRRELPFRLSGPRFLTGRDRILGHAEFKSMWRQTSGLNWRKCSKFPRLRRFQEAPLIPLRLRLDHSRGILEAMSYNDQVYPERIGVITEDDIFQRRLAFRDWFGRFNL